MKLKIEIEIGNDAMLTGEDLAYAVRRVAQSVESVLGEDAIKPSTIVAGTSRDDNGNKVGWWGIE